jgi:hypothetical protein
LKLGKTKSGQLGNRVYWTSKLIGKVVQGKTNYKGIIMTFDGIRFNCKTTKRTNTEDDADRGASNQSSANQQS